MKSLPIAVVASHLLLLHCPAVTPTLEGLRADLPSLAEPFDYSSECAASVVKSARLRGDPDRYYDVQFRFRGLVEEKTYAEGRRQGYWHVGGTPANDSYNIYQLEISDPPQVYYLNSGKSKIEKVRLIDYAKTLRVAGGAEVILRALSVDLLDVGNWEKLVVPGVPPAPAPYPGQFLQVDVEAVTPAGRINRAPLVEVTSDVILAADEGSVTVSATVADDGEPQPANVRSWWRQVAGPASVVFTPGIYDPKRGVCASHTRGKSVVLRLEGRAFQRAVRVRHLLRVQAWRGRRGRHGAPFLGVYINRTDADVPDGTGLFKVDEVNLHPSNTGRYAVVRWTAPTAGDFMLDGSFSNRGTFTRSSTAIVKNGDTIFSANVSTAVPSQPFRQIVSVQAGEHVDFAVGWGTDSKYANDLTGLKLTISPVDVRTVAARVSTPGTYVIEHVAFDGASEGSGQVRLVVPGATNQPPLARAGVHRTLTTGATITLSGLARDDGLPAGSAPSTWWSHVSGPARIGRANFSNAAADAATIAPNAVGGAWSYGSKPAALGAFTPLPACLPDAYPGRAKQWQRDENGPFVTSNYTGHDFSEGTATFKSDELSLHPAIDGDRAVVRWTAPAAGVYVAESYFAGRQKSTTSDVQVVQGGKAELWADHILSLNA